MMATEYDHDNLPNSEVFSRALPEEMLPEAKDVIRELMDSNMLTAEEVRAGYVFERKGYMEFTAIGDSPNLSYQSSSDDMIIQLTLRIPAPSTYTTVPEMQKVEKLVARVEEAQREAERKRLEAQREAERKRLEAVIEAEEAKAAKALEAAKAKREALARLNQK